MTLEEYATKILSDSGCDNHTYGGGQAKHLVDDLKQAFPDGMEYGYGYVEVANAILAMSRPEPIVRAPYRVHWDTEHDSDGLDCESFEAARAYAEDTLVEWMAEEMSQWKCDEPTVREKENWDCMIYNCGVCVSKYDKTTDTYKEVWSPSYEELDLLGWKPFFD